MAKPLIIAHRAITPQSAENAISSLPVLDAAGADLVELDIRLSLDRRPFVTHDAFLTRTTRGRGWVRLWPSPLLRRVRLRQGAPNERVPSLSETLRAFPARLQPALHLKDRGALNQVLRTIMNDGNPSQTWLWLEHPSDIRRARTRNSLIRCTLLRPAGWTPANRIAYIRDAQACGARAISVPWGVITPELTTLAHQRNLLVFSRLQESPSIAQNVHHGVDGIITENPSFVTESLLRMTNE